MSAELEFIQGDYPGRKLALAAADLTIGRDPSSNIVLQHSSASRAHAKLFVRSDLWHVVDMGSSNGTHVNGMRISTTPVQLRPGDLIQIGPNVIRFQETGAALQATTAWTTASQLQATTHFQAPEAVPVSHQSMPQAFPTQVPMQTHMQQQMVVVQGRQNLTWLWVFLCILALGPCGIACLAMVAIKLLPFAMVIGGLISGIVGQQMYRRFNGHPGWEGHAQKGLILTIGGFTAAALGALWIFVAWLAPGSGTWDSPEKTEERPRFER